MLNIEEFTKRLEHLFEIYELTPSTFADKIGVQRSSISHLLSGRNKPSLDFVLKVQDVFPDVELNWLLHGRGNFNTNTPLPPTTLPDASDLFSQNEPVENNVIEIKNEVNEVLEVSKEPKTTNNEKTIADSLFNTDIEKIVIFYKNGTFKSFKPD
jgi:DNA-binding XRE family transcriptional regulator